MCQHNAKDLNLKVDAEKLKPLFKTNTLRHTMAMFFDWAIIAATIYGCIQFFNPITYILAVMIIGARMHALAILMHDATHYRFLKNRKWNDLITNITTMYPIFTTIETYRQNHLRHHTHLNTEHDPDWVAKLGKQEFTFPKSKLEFVSTILSYFTLYQGIKDAIWFLKRFSPTDKTKAPKNSKSFLRLSFYVVLFSLLTLIDGGWKFYLLLWIVPYLSTFFMYQYIRSVAEHFGELKRENLLNATRTVMPHVLERFLLAPHQVGYHLEHHLYPGVPFYNLPKLHEVLMEDPGYSEQAHITYGYIGGLMNELGSDKLLALD